MLQFQHGTIVENADGSLSLTPFSVDGRQLQSNPCAGSTSIYTRYNQSETMEACSPLFGKAKSGVLLTRSQKYQVYIDPYTKMTRLDLYKFNGTPMPPMYLAFNPPQMLPTVTMNPTTTAAATGKKAKRTLGAGDGLAEPLNKNAVYAKREHEDRLIHRVDLDMMWYTGVGMLFFGIVAYCL